MYLDPVIRLGAFAVVGILVGCGPNLRTVSSGVTGCPESEIEISDEERGFTGVSWKATCRGRVFYCSHTGGGSCTEEVEAKPVAAALPAPSPRAPSNGPIVVSRTLEFVGGGNVSASGKPTEDGSRIELLVKLVREPVTVSSWAECTEGVVVADDVQYALRDVSVQASTDGRPPTLSATARVGELIRLVKSKQRSGVTVCGQKNWLDKRARVTLFALLKEFEPLAVKHGTWDPSLEHDSDRVPPPTSTSVASSPEEAPHDASGIDADTQTDGAAAP